MSGSVVGRVILQLPMIVAQELLRPVMPLRRVVNALLWRLPAQRGAA